MGEITNTWPRSYRPATSNSTTVCSRVLPVCQYRPVPYPLGIAANTIHQNCHVGAPMPLLEPQSYGPRRLRNFLSKRKSDYSWFGSPPLIIFSIVSYLSNSVVYHHFLWHGGESYWLTCLPQYPPLWHAHTSLPTKRISLPSLSGFYCTHSRTTETPK